MGFAEAAASGFDVGSLINEQLWDENGATLAIALAARHGGPFGTMDALPLLQWLHARGADLDSVDEKGDAVLHVLDWSIGETAFVPLLRWLLQDVGVQHLDHRNSAGDTPSFLCACYCTNGDDAQRGLEF